MIKEIYLKQLTLYPTALVITDFSSVFDGAEIRFYCVFSVLHECTYCKQSEVKFYIGDFYKILSKEYKIC